MSWEADLEECTWRGIKFNVQSITDSQRRKRAAYEFPYRDGVKHEDMGREPRPTNFTAVFIGPTYLNEVGQLQAEVDTGLKGTFNHPLFGAWEAHVDLGNIEHSHDQRDKATVQIEVIETGLDVELDPALSLDSLSIKITVQISDLESASDALPETSGFEKVVNDVTTLTTKASALQSAVSDNLAIVDQKMSESRQAARDLIATVKSVHPDNLARAITKRAQYLAETCRQIAQVVKSNQPQIKQHSQQVEGGLHLVVFAKSGDVDNLDEIINLNKIRNPNRIKPGQSVAVFEKDNG